MATPFVPFRCELSEENFKVVFPDKNGQREQPTFGLVESEEEWVALRSALPAEHGPQHGRLRRLERRVTTNLDVEMPDGSKVRVWGFQDENGARTYPSPPIRVAGGDLVQVRLASSTRQHTIHHHGLEPDMDNDGVGHTSFEVFGDYTYQWRAHPANAGTFFYHCHVNTTLHVQMGLFGALIIDPPGTDLSTPVSRANPRKSLTDAPDEWAYTREAIWALHSIDPEWHRLSADAGMCGDDAGLNDYKPRWFLINGHPQDPAGGPIASTDAAIEADLGDTILLRLINADYYPIEVDFGQLDPLIIESDGRALRSQIDLGGLGVLGRPVSAPWTAIDGVLAPAERYGLLIRPPARGTFPVEVRFRHWITHEVVGIAKTEVRIT